MFSFKSILLIAAVFTIGAECSAVPAVAAAPLIAPASIGYAHAVPQNIPPYAAQVNVVSRAINPVVAAAPFAAQVAAPFAAPVGPIAAPLAAPLPAPYAAPVPAPFAPAPYIAGPAPAPYLAGPVPAPYGVPAAYAAAPAAYAASPYPYSAPLIRSAYAPAYWR